MKINDMFQKDIGRPIQGVVRIGQNEPGMIANELDEYVVTKELHKHFDKFFEIYRKGTQQRTDKIGVWISGFFGSGKSHFLKILSYIIGGETYNGKKAINYFDGKILDSRVLADMQLASDTNADVILFNIDAEASSDSKSNKDPIVKVFMKVFNRMQGFCSTMPWIAELEKEMVREGSYDAFRLRFKEISGRTWEDARRAFRFEQKNIVQALSETTRMDSDAALAWCNKAEANYSLDINYFARSVREYIEEKENETGKKHFVVFLCDEVGQYIGSSGSLMLNLQNIVEGLGNECSGRAWLICTGQEDIDSIVNVNRDNFSKIIGRFDTRLSLSSANVDEVIKKRLLAKSENATDRLRLLYEEKNSGLKNLIVFTQDTPEKRIYDTADDFVEVYPFIPYQFKLLQAVFNGIRKHGASGKHLSEGERSLLNAFQEAAGQYVGFEDNIIIPFDAFYRTVETFLDHNIRRVILNAEETAGCGDSVLMPEDVEVLKVLFMVKYIDNVLPANFENITTIMLQNMEEDKIELKKRIDGSLRRLEKQRLIIENGGLYVFLTNEEQDINREIREIRVDQKELISKIGDQVFDLLFGVNRKYRHNDRYDFAFNTIIDDRPVGNQREEMGIKVLTPQFSSGMDVSQIMLMSLRELNIIMVLPPSMEFMNEMEQALQIDTFVRRSLGKTGTDSFELIKSTKEKESKQRVVRCRDLIAIALNRADFYVNGNKLDIREKAYKQRIDDVFKVLVSFVYSRQGYLVKPYANLEALREIIAGKDDSLIMLDGMESKEINHLALDDVSRAIEQSHYKNAVTTMRGLTDQFGKTPYGWRDIDIAGLLLVIFIKQKIRFELNGQAVLSTDKRIIDYVTKREYADRLVIKWRDIISLALINNAKDIAREVFGRTDVPNDEDGLMERIKSFAADELHGNTDSIKDLLRFYEATPYPGKKVLEDGRKLFEQLERFKDVKTFFEHLHSEKDLLLDYEEDVQDIKKFFKNQKTIFDKALEMLEIYKKNDTYIVDKETKELVAEIEKITKLASPYSEIHKLPDLRQQFMKQFSEILEKECAPLIATVESNKEVVLADLKRRTFQGNEEIRNKFHCQVRDKYGGFIDKLNHINNMYDAVYIQSESERFKIQFIQKFIDEEARLTQLAIEQAEIDNTPPPTPAPKTKTVAMKNLFAGTTQLSNEAEVNKFVEDIRKRLITQLEENTTIQIV